MSGTVTLEIDPGYRDAIVAGAELRKRLVDDAISDFFAKLHREMEPDAKNEDGSPLSRSSIL